MLSSELLPLLILLFFPCCFIATKHPFFPILPQLIFLKGHDGGTGRWEQNPSFSPCVWYSALHNVASEKKKLEHKKKVSYKLYLVSLVLPHFIFILCFGPNIAEHHHKIQVFIALSGSKEHWSVQINCTAWTQWAPWSKLGFGICHSSTELPWGKAVAAFVTLLASLLVPGLEKSASCKAG